MSSGAPVGYKFARLRPMNRGMGRRLRIRDNEHGFTIVEVMIAMVILLVGLGGSLTLLDQANTTTTSTKAREGAVALSRELVEAARAQSYDQLTQGNLVATTRARQGFTSSTLGGSGWQIERRGITYTMSLGVCSVDDPKDGTGQTDTTFCASTGQATRTSAANCTTGLGNTGDISGVGTAAGVAVGDCGIDLDRDGQVDNLTLGDVGSSPGAACTGTGCDLNPDDYKRVVTLVRWTLGSGSRFVLQSTSLPYPGLSGAPRVTALPILPSLTVTSPTQTTFGSTTTATNRKAAGVTWLIDGTPTGNATANDATGKLWTFTWQLGTASCNSSGVPTSAAPAAGEVVDGVYQIGAKAVDAFAQAGGTRTQVVTLNRCRPFAPTGLVAALIGISGVEAAWAASPERDIEGYELWRVQGAGTPQLACSLARNRRCVEQSPPNSGLWNYYVLASDKDSGGTVQPGLKSTAVTVDLGNRVPAPPLGALAGSRASTTNATITWGPSPGDPDAGDSVVAYRIYRDGTTLNDRYATVTAGTYSYTDTTAADAHTYYVAAVDSKGAESVKTTGVYIP